MIKILFSVFVLFPLSSWGNKTNPCGNYSDYTDKAEFNKCLNDQRKHEKDLAEFNRPVNPLPTGNYAHCNRYKDKDDEAKYQQCIHEERMFQRGGDQKPTCFDDLSNSFTGGLGRNYQHQVDESRQLLGAAERRFGTLKDCRRELRESWIDFQRKKTDHMKERSLLPIKLRQAEIDYQKELNRIRRDCRQKSNKEFAKYKENIQEKGNIGPHQLHGFGNRINSHRHHFYKSCYQSTDNVQAMETAKKQLALNMDKAKAEMKVVDDMMTSFTEQTELIQEDIKRDCEDQKRLNKYNEALARRNTSKASFNNRINTALDFTKSISNCMDGGGVFGNNVPTKPLRSASSQSAQ